MKATAFAGFLLPLVLPWAEGRLLRAQQRLAQPDAMCGKGFDKLVAGSQQYFKTAQVKLWTHPGRNALNGTFERELQCWFSHMTTTKCGGLPAVLQDGAGEAV